MKKCKNEPSEVACKRGSERWPVGVGQALGGVKGPNRLQEASEDNEQGCGGCQEALMGKGRSVEVKWTLFEKQKGPRKGL